MQTVLNLGCGEKTSDRCINLDWSPYLRIKSNWLLRITVTPFLTPRRREKLRRISPNLMVHDLRRGIPFPDDSVDSVYHSHFLEHIDRDMAPAFLREVRRVLRVGGIHRVCVPDLAEAHARYAKSLALCQQSLGEGLRHDDAVAGLYEQSVRKESFGTSQQSPMRRRLENLVLGDARRRGETHQWMYDQYNLRHILTQAGFREFEVRTFSSSGIADWSQFKLETNSDDSEYKPGSLYLECVK